MLVNPELRQRVSFRHANLNTALPEFGKFDLVFLRNVMIYFNNETKRYPPAPSAHSGHADNQHREHLL